MTIRTYDRANAANSTQLVVDIGADNDGNVLVVRASSSRNGSELKKHTTTITIVLCPREKKSPQVIASWPRLMMARVALSIALSLRISC